MKLIEQMKLCDSKKTVISIVGAGGKTTLLYLLAREYACMGLTVGVTTTTHIYRPMERDIAVVVDGFGFPAWGGITAYGTTAVGGKLSSPDQATLARVIDCCDILLIEADGSRRLPLKLPNDTEPVILPQTDRVIIVAGLSAMGSPLKNVCHRFELAQDRLEFSPEQIVTPEVMAKVLLCGYGDIAGASILLNQADTPELVAQGEETARLLSQRGVENIWITALNKEAQQC